MQGNSVLRMPAVDIMATPPVKIRPAVSIWLFLFSASVFLAFSMADPDYWGHIRFGRAIFESKGVLQSDVFSYTAGGLKWINHEWLSEVVFWVCYKNFADSGMVFLRLFTGLLFCFFLYKIVETKNLPGTIVAYLLVLFTVVPFWHFRPQIFTFLFFAVLLRLLDSKRPFFIPFIFLLWANMHGGFAAGLAYFFLFSVFSADRRKLFPIFTASFLLTFVNPYGWTLWLGILRAFFNPLTRIYITDWQPPRFFDMDFAGYWGLILILAYFTAVKIKTLRLAEAVLPAVFLILSLTSIRHIPVFAIACAPLLRIYFSGLPSAIYSKAVLVIAASLTALALCFKPKFRVDVDENAYPAGAVEYLKKTDFSGNIFCEFDWGEYLLFHLYPRVKVSLDGRYDTVYPAGFIKNSFEFLNSSTGVLPEKTDAVLVYSGRNIPVGRNWRKTYSDKTAVFYEIR